MAHKAPNLEIGTVINGKYRVEELIGSGGMGAVYEATQLPIGRKVAVKLLHRDFIEDREVLGRFQREAELAGSIGHDNICEVTDVGTSEDGEPYLVMPLFRGGSLGELLATEGKLGFDRTGDIVCQVLAALEAAHGANIVHRDLKPRNILITKMGDRDDFVKLLDFGISKVLDQDIVSELTESGVVLGTPHYMAPEQARGSRDLDHRVDVYAAGVILYEALTGKRPFVGDSYNEVMFKIVSDPFPAPSTLNPSIPEDLNKVVLKAMSRHPTDRYASASEMRDAVKTALQIADTGPRAQTNGTTYKTAAKSVISFSRDAIDSRRIARRRRLALMALALLAAAVIGIAVSALVSGEGQEAQITSTPAPEADSTAGSASSKMARPESEAKSAKKGHRTVIIEETPAVDTAPSQVASPVSQGSGKTRGKSRRSKSLKGVAKTRTDKVDKPTSRDKRTIEGRFGTKIVDEF